MSTAIPKLEIVVGDFPLDGARVTHKGGQTLFLRPQAFSSAVRHVRNVLPQITLEDAERLVREQCPEFRDFDDLLGTNDAPAPRVEDAEPTAPTADTPARSRRWRMLALTAAILPALAASWALGRLTAAEPTPAPSGAGAAPSSPHNSQQGAAPFNDAPFKYFAGAGNIDCKPMNTLEAECTDADGMVMATQAATGPDSVVFTFSYGHDRIGLRIFHDAEYANTWARQDGTIQLYPGLEVHDRYALWGTDTHRIKEYRELLQRAPVSGPQPQVLFAPHPLPLPPRLAALTLGTLGLDEHDVKGIITSSAGPKAAARTEEPVMMAALMVLGMDTKDPGEKPTGQDIVAIAAGFNPHPPVTAPTPTVLPAAAITPATASASPPKLQPTTDPSVVAPPVQPTPRTTPEPSTTPAAPTSTPEVAPAPDPVPSPHPTTDQVPTPTPEPGPTTDPVPVPVPEPEPDPSRPGPTECPSLPFPSNGGPAARDGELVGLPAAWVAQR
ncbi:hypothetical protein AB0O57_29525 [Streptomyces sp. NPDC091201]|uniref:hypothetical protein n=1 Tax=Streptomyces sp. NPDC091201 TaxID=3155190 RepID=UPI00342A35B6